MNIRDWERRKEKIVLVTRLREVFRGQPRQARTQHYFKSFFENNLVYKTSSLFELQSQLILTNIGHIILCRLSLLRTLKYIEVKLDNGIVDVSQFNP